MSELRLEVVFRICDTETVSKGLGHIEGLPTIIEQESRSNRLAHRLGTLFQM